MKKASIKMAILIPSLAVLISGVIVMVSVIGVLSSKSTNDLTSRLIEARVAEYTNEFRALCQEMYGVATVTTPIVSNYIDPGFVAESADPRREVISILSKALMSNEGIIGMWTCWEPNAFDGKDHEWAGSDYHDQTGRFVPYVYRSGNSYEIEALAGYDSEVDGEYYHGPLKTGKPYITDPYHYTTGGTDTLLCTISIPIFNDGKVVGVVGADLDMNKFITTMNAASILDDGYLLTISPGGCFATHPNNDMVLTRYDLLWMKDYSQQIETLLENGGSFNVKAYSEEIKSNVNFLGTGVMIGDTGRYWLVCSVVPEATVNAYSTELLWTIVAIGTALIALVGATIFLIVRNRLKDLPVLTSAAEGMALGDIDSVNLDAGAEATKNEISLLSRAFFRMTDGIRQQADVMSQIARGDYSVTAHVRSDKDVMNQAINQMLDSSNKTLYQISSASAQVSTGSKQIADGAQILVQGATEQSETVEKLSVSIGEVASKTNQNAEMAKEASILSDSIKRDAEKGSIQMDQMMQAVKEINEASSSISKVIKSIDDIAFQTNILALNAAVEAARAGQHGKGFAVVADEVRNLAAKSAEAAKDTGGLIENSIEKANMGSSIAAETASSLNEIVEGINRSVEIVNKIARSSEEQTEAIDLINTGIDQVARVVHQNSATAEESAAASEEMSGQSSLLEDLTSQFKLRNLRDHASLDSNSRNGMSAIPESTAFALADNSGGNSKY